MEAGPFLQDPPTRFTIGRKLGILVGAAMLSLVALTVFFLVSTHANLVEEREELVRAQVQSVATLPDGLALQLHD